MFVHLSKCLYGFLSLYFNTLELHFICYMFPFLFLQYIRVFFPHVCCFMVTPICFQVPFVSAQMFPCVYAFLCTSRHIPSTFFEFLGIFCPCSYLSTFTSPYTFVSLDARHDISDHFSKNIFGGYLLGRVQSILYLLFEYTLYLQKNLLFTNNPPILFKRLRHFHTCLFAT